MKENTLKVLLDTMARNTFQAAVFPETNPPPHHHKMPILTSLGCCFQ